MQLERIKTIYKSEIHMHYTNVLGVIAMYTFYMCTSSLYIQNMSIEKNHEVDTKIVFISTFLEFQVKIIRCIRSA